MTGYDLQGKTVLAYNYRGDGLCRRLLITSVRNTHDERVKAKTYFRNPITRGEFLVTATDLDRQAVRSYYLSRFESIRTIGFWGKIWHKIRMLTSKEYANTMKKESNT